MQRCSKKGRIELATTHFDFATVLANLLDGLLWAEFSVGKLVERIDTVRTGGAAATVAAAVADGGDSEASLLAAAAMPSLSAAKVTGAGGNSGVADDDVVAGDGSSRSGAAVGDEDGECVGNAAAADEVGGAAAAYHAGSAAEVGSILHEYKQAEAIVAATVAKATTKARRGRVGANAVIKVMYKVRFERKHTVSPNLFFSFF